MLIVVKLFPPNSDLLFSGNITHSVNTISITKHLLSAFTVSEFSQLFSHEHILPLIIFAGFVGFAIRLSGKKAQLFSRLLHLATDVFMRVFSYILYYAPIGFFAYFAVLVGSMGSNLITTYYHATLVYYTAGIIYFICALSFYAYLAGKLPAVKLFWKNTFIPAMTALATCSSAASIPANLDASKKMGVSETIYELVIPLGSILHKDGSVLGAMVKIAFLFSIYHMDFISFSALLLAILVSLLVGTVMGAIPSGGMVGEMLILSVYGFPQQALMMIAAISLIIDPLATMINVTSNSVCTLMVNKLNSKKSYRFMVF